MLSYKEILCPTDFSEPSFQALLMAVELATPAGELCLLHVMSVNGENGVEEAETNLRTLIRDYLPASLKVNCLVRRGDVTAEILRVTEEKNADLIVLATHGHTGWREFALGSVADEVVRLAPCPVLTFNNAAHKRRNEVHAAKAGSEQAAPLISEADFPREGSTEAKLRFLLNYAILAPSNRNSQPWLWEVEGNKASLFADPSRSLPYLDPRDRELTISCGAALQYLQLAIHHFGHSAHIEALPEGEDPNLLARLRISDAPPDSRSHAQDEALLFASIHRRHTNRHPFLQRELPAALKGALQAEARHEEAWLVFIENMQKRLEIINLISQSDHVQGSNRKLVEETVSWIHPEGGFHSDGIPLEAIGKGGLPSRYTLDAGEAQADKDQILSWSASSMVVLGTDDDTPRGWLAAGQALARILLRASAGGVQASFFNSPVEVIENWARLHHIIGRAGFPQLIFRLGYPAIETGATPRRSVNEVLRVVDS